MAFNQAKVSEAKEHIKSAEKFLKTTMFRWKPDADSAADEYSQAAQCFRIARDMENAKACHIKAAECFKKCNSLFHAAKAMENAVLVSKEIATPDELYDMAIESACLYQQHGSGDAAASILDKAGKLLERRNGDLATKLFVQAADASSGNTKYSQFFATAHYLRLRAEFRQLLREESESVFNFIRNHDICDRWIENVGNNGISRRNDADDVEPRPHPGMLIRPSARPPIRPQPAARDQRPSSQSNQAAQTESGQHQGSEYIAKASRILVRLQRYDEALDCLRREIGFHQESGNTGAIGRLTVAIVLVQLARGDTVAAEKAYKEWGSNCEVAEMQTLEQILQAYDEEDREAAKRALASPFIRNMDVEYARLAATVPLPEAMEPAPRAAVRENAAPSYVSPNAQSTTTAEISHELEESPYAPVTYTKKSDEEDGLC